MTYIAYKRYNKWKTSWSILSDDEGKPINNFFVMSLLFVIFRYEMSNCLFESAYEETLRICNCTPSFHQIAMRDFPWLRICTGTKLKCMKRIFHGIGNYNSVRKILWHFFLPSYHTENIYEVHFELSADFIEEFFILYLQNSSSDPLRLSSCHSLGNQIIEFTYVYKPTDNFRISGSCNERYVV